GGGGEQRLNGPEKEMRRARSRRKQVEGHPKCLGCKQVRGGVRHKKASHGGRRKGGERRRRAGGAGGEREQCLREAEQPRGRMRKKGGKGPRRKQRQNIESEAGVGPHEKKK
ncbi:hypothetical protein ACIRL1_21710, partial [Bacillus subtilis]